MRPTPSSPTGPQRPDPVARALGGGALLVSLLALVFAMTGSSPAAPQQPVASDAGTLSIGGEGRERPQRGSSGRRTPRRRSASRRGAAGGGSRLKPFGLVRLDRNGKIPGGAIPKVAAARSADRLGDVSADDLGLNCPAESVDLGSWCLDSATTPLEPQEEGKNDFFFATQKCVARGGYLPTAAQLIGAAERVKLSSVIADSDLTASIDENPADGRKDQREMTATLMTTTAGSSAAGSQGPSIGSRGNPLEGEPDPIPQPADPQPSTLQYITVYDNRNSGGFAGGKPVGSAERFRCAFDKAQGSPPPAD